MQSSQREQEEVDAAQATDGIRAGQGRWHDRGSAERDDAFVLLLGGEELLVNTNSSGTPASGAGQDDVGAGAADLLYLAVQVDRGGSQTVLREQPGLLTAPRTAAVGGQAVAPKVVHRCPVGSGPGFLLLDRRRLEGVPVGQMRRGQPLDLVGGGDLQHAEDAQHIRAQVVARSRLVLLALARHQPRPPVVRDQPAAGRRPPAVEGTGPPGPMISPTTDNQLKDKRREWAVTSRRGPGNPW
ncbi:hypothetical protein [Streptomyces sp. NPDC001851]|uniref:hypothetical protein n=1 Tax=Streptomyces sp. NPDC001851 TaxID=3154529 RepID=UPI003333A393